MKPKSQFRNLEVVSTCELSQHLKRIVFTGEDLEDFPSDYEGGYVKVILLEDKSLIQEGERPKMRSYTIAEFDTSKKQLTIDFMINHHNGHTSVLASRAKVGDRIVIAGPGPRKLDNFKSNKYLFFGDLTSVNAVRGSVNQLSKESKVEINLFVPTKDDFFDLNLKNPFSVNWIVADESDYLTDAARKSQLLDSKTIVFAASEAKRIKSLRDYLTKERGLVNDSLFISGYWREGLTDEQYRAEKHKYK